MKTNDLFDKIFGNLNELDEIFKNTDILISEIEQEDSVPQVIYISHPYTADNKYRILNNVQSAMELAAEVIKLGCTPVVPHTFHYVDEILCEQAIIPMSHEGWMEHCITLLDRCDAILYTGYSNGCNQELAYAIANNIPVYFSIDELAEDVKQLFHYFLAQQGCDIYRLGIEGDKELIEQWLNKVYANVSYIDEYNQLFIYDIDKDVGIGNRCIDGGIIRTCKHVHAMLPRKATGNIYEQLEKVHRQIKERENNEENSED